MRRLAVALLAVALSVVGCTDAEKKSAAGPTYERYVALGDSFSAGPLIPTSDLAGGCLRSDHNYPSLVARRLKVRTFIDVTCSGATTGDLRNEQKPFEDSRIPPQLNVVTPETDLVTLGIGGNDLRLFGTLVGTCTRLRSTEPNGAPCARRLAADGLDTRQTIDVISSRVTASLRRIKRQAPQATVVLVGYLRLVPDRGTCDELPLATGDYAEGRRISKALDQGLRRAARRSNVAFADMYAASRGHDICAADPWVNGSVTDRQKALSYHPLASGMRADARAVLAALERR